MSDFVLLKPRKKEQSGILTTSIRGKMPASGWRQIRPTKCHQTDSEDTKNNFIWGIIFGFSAQHSHSAQISNKYVADKQCASDRVTRRSHRKTERKHNDLFGPSAKTVLVSFPVQVRGGYPKIWYLILDHKWHYWANVLITRGMSMETNVC